MGGKVLTPIGSDGAFANALVIQPDGKLVAAGSGVDFLLARYKPNGGLDPSFGSGGIVTTPIGDDAEAYALVIQPDGRLVAAGTSLDDATSALVFALARYKPNGRLDRTFGRGGKVTTPIGPVENGAFALVRQRDGNLVAAGYQGTTFGNAFTLARYRK